MLVTFSLLTLVAIVARPVVADWLDDHRGEVGDEWWDGSSAEQDGPPADSLPELGSAPWIVASGGTEPVGSGTLYRYRVEVEQATGLDAGAVADVVDYALGHPRGWTNDGFAFQRVGPDDGEVVDMVVRVATPGTVDQLCAPLETNGQVSCRNGVDVVLNQVRWDAGVDAYAGDIERYRVVLVNHEVGHLIGHAEHVPCPGYGLPAPVMMQLFYTGLQGCVANIWPYADDGTFVG
ncbi:MAG TPA: DUF3152 domain-containing protein [Jiangellales bacterium]|nr:DUF3152 domain-containing protein [Jiangellales bacterium]